MADRDPTVTEGVWVAFLIGVAGPTAVALIGLVEMRRRVGKPNGAGNLVEMAERLLSGQARQDERIAALEENDHRIASQLGRIHSTLREREPVIQAMVEQIGVD